MTPGDSVRVTIGGRVYGATVVYVRGGSVRLDFDGKRKPMTLPAGRCTPAKRTVVDAVVEQTGQAIVIAEPRKPLTRRDWEDARNAPRPVPKPKPPWRSSAYMAHVRTFPCCVSGDPAEEAHHHGKHAMSRKGPDWLCIPMTSNMHEYFHRTGTFMSRTRVETDAHAIKAQIECMTAWCEAHGLDYMTAVRDALARVVESDG